jgi:hypothetical protein
MAVMGSYCVDAVLMTKVRNTVCARKSTHINFLHVYNRTLCFVADEQAKEKMIVMHPLPRYVTPSGDTPLFEVLVTGRKNVPFGTGLERSLWRWTPTPVLLTSGFSALCLCYC